MSDLSPRIQQAIPHPLTLRPIGLGNEYLWVSQ